MVGCASPVLFFQAVIRFRSAVKDSSADTDIKPQLVFRLPVVKISPEVIRVISPDYQLLRKLEKKIIIYEGVFDFCVAKNESVLISVSKLNGDFVSCKKNRWHIRSSLNLTIVNENATKTWCDGPHTIPAQLVHSSLHLHSHGYTFKHPDTPVFQMLMAVLPRSEEPRVLLNNFFNCCVSSFNSFRSVLACNLLGECEGGEDERDCGYRSNDCGYDAIDAGTKCYRLVRPQRPLTWFEAASYCSQRGLNLATFGTLEEFTQFKTLMSPASLLFHIFVGGHLINRISSAWILPMYKNSWQWVDRRTAFFIQIRGTGEYPLCSMYTVNNLFLTVTSCTQVKEAAAFVCESDKSGADYRGKNPSDIKIDVPVHHPDVAWNVSVIPCPSGHVSRDFLSCEISAECGVMESVSSCSAGSITVPMFVCQRSRSTLHYTLVCDHMQHCSDNSDEDFCQFPECPPSFVTCRNGQCVHELQVCDENFDCLDGSDEVCWSSGYKSVRTYISSVPPGVLYLDNRGIVTVTPINVSDDCPHTHFHCVQGFCLPFYLRCNGIDDCPFREDEAGCDSYVCPGFYRCLKSQVCTHAENVCDGVPQCPQHDDELLCDLVCPDQCRCQGLAYVCSTKLDARSYPDLRYLDARGTGMTLRDFGHNALLIGLGLSTCRMSSVHLNITLPNLRELDLSWNDLTRIDLLSFRTLKNLRLLLLSGNPLEQMINSHISGSEKTKLQHLDLSHTTLEVLSGRALSSTPVFKVLNISRSRLTFIEPDGFQFTPLLELVDMTGSPLITFPNDLLRNLERLRIVHADDFKLCCQAVLPVNFDLRNCHTIQDLLASCEDLLRSDTYRFFLWIFASMSVVGNMVSFVARFYLQKKSRTRAGFNVFITNLFLADLFMEVYLTIIGTADLVFHGEYLWRDNEWKRSTACQIAGFLCLMSSEVSAFIICLITLDRFLVLRFPFSRLRFGSRSAIAACGFTWIVGISLAIVPFIPGTSQREFYSETGICIPLPFTNSNRFFAHSYFFDATILLNMVLFHLIAVGQAVVFWSVRANSLPSANDRGSRDAAIARRLTTVVVSDFLCWFPVGLLGLLASRGTPIPGELSVAVVILVLPVNSALNPFLYTLNVLMERRRKAAHENLLKRLEKRMKAKYSQDTSRNTSEAVDKPAAHHQIKTWLRELVLTPEDLLACSH